MKKVIIIAALLYLPACAYLKQAQSSLDHFYFHQNSHNHKLIILLPGITDNARDFKKNGIVAQLRRCQPDANILYADTHFGYYRERILTKRLHNDIILPAQQAGIKNIWLLGISLGGLGSLLYRNQYPENITGIVTLAPFLGLARDFNYFKKNKHDALYLPEFIVFWHDLQKTAKEAPYIYLGFGTKDTYRKQQTWLKQLLSKEQVVIEDGKHDWPSWRKILPALLKKAPLCNS